MSRVLAIVAGLAFCVSGRQVRAESELSPIAPFTGDFSEGFESFSGEIPGLHDNVSGPVSILEGRAWLSGIHPNRSANPFYVWDSCCGFSLDDLTTVEGHVQAVPFDRARGLHLQTVLNMNPIAKIEFPTPVSEFGGYWVHAVTRTMAGPITISMFDAEGAAIDTVELHYDYENLQGVHEWFGWSSTTPVGSLTFTGPWAGIDGIQINLIPEPTTKISLFIGCFALVASRQCRRRRKGDAAHFYGAGSRVRRNATSRCWSRPLACCVISASEVRSAHSRRLRT
jgi:hypothetical protein